MYSRVAATAKFQSDWRLVDHVQALVEGSISALIHLNALTIPTTF